MYNGSELRKEIEGPGGQTLLGLRLEAIGALIAAAIVGGGMRSGSLSTACRADARPPLLEQHRLYFRPLPHRQRSFLPIVMR